MWDGLEQGCDKQMSWKIFIIVQSIEEGSNQVKGSRVGEEVMRMKFVYNVEGDMR